MGLSGNSPALLDKGTRFASDCTAVFRPCEYLLLGCWTNGSFVPGIGTLRFNPFIAGIEDVGCERILLWELVISYRPLAFETEVEN